MEREIENCKLRIANCKLPRTGDSLAEREFCRRAQFSIRPVGRGFTLVELLIVISIIGVLVSLLMPAVNSAREAGRRAVCSNNLHQMALGCLALESKYQYLPGGGWGWQWAGEPDRGYGARQPGGWHFNILPFIDQTDLHDMGKALNNDAARRGQGQLQAQTAVAVFLCPTRNGRLQVFPGRTGMITSTSPIPHRSLRVATMPPTRGAIT